MPLLSLRPAGWESRRSWQCLLLRVAGSICSVIQGCGFQRLMIVERSDFLVTTGLRSPFSLWLLVGGCSQLLEVVTRSLPSGSLHKCSHNMSICSFTATGESESVSSGRSQSLSRDHLIR